MIRIESLTFGYRKKEPVFRELDLELPSGHIYGLFGKNGAGKSTLLKSICGLVFPDKGTCSLLGCQVKERHPGTLQNMFIVPEEFYLPWTSLEKFLKTYAPFYPLFNREEFEQYLEEFDVSLSSHLGRLSHGQKKKILISFGLAANTAVLLLDEPTNGLDIPSKSTFRKLVASAFDEKRTIVIATHQVRDLDNLIDTMIILHDHQVAVNASIEHILSKIAFHTVPGKSFDEAADHLLFSQDCLKGYDILIENKTGDHTRMDMELFFNAVTGPKPGSGAGVAGSARGDSGRKITNLLN